MLDKFLNIRFLFIFTFISVFTLCVSGQTQVEDRPKVGLVLSGGGAKGFAHVGVLKVFEEYNIPIDYIGGTSIGAIIGGLYAVGYTSDQLEEMILDQDWESLFLNEPDRTFMPFFEKEEKDRYLIKMQLVDGKFQIPNYALDNNGIIKFFSDLTVGYHHVNDFNELPIPFMCVAVDLVTGKEVVLNSGSLAEAMGASMALPGIFPSINNDTAIFVDGGVRNNFPVDHVRAMGADIIIGIDIGAGMRDRDELESFGGMIDQLTTLLSEAKYNENMPDCDYFIKPDISDFSSMDFSHEDAIKLLEVGERAGRESEHFFKELDTIFASYEFEKVDDFVRMDTLSTKYVTAFEVRGTSLSDDKVLGILGVNFSIEELYNFEDIQVGIKRLHASTLFSSIRYQLYEDSISGGYTLTLDLEDYAKSTVNFGAHYNSQDNVALLLNGTFNTLFSNNSRVSADVKIAENPAVNFAYNVNRGSLPGIAVEYGYRSRLMGGYLDGEKIGEASVRKHFVEINTNSVINRYFTVGLGARYENFLTKDKVGTLPLDNGKDDYILYKFFFKLDNRDDSYYSTQGGDYSFSALAITDNGYTLDDNVPIAVSTLSMKHFFSFTNVWTFAPSLNVQVQIAPNAAPPIFYDTYVGGVYQSNDIVSQVPFWGLQWGEYRANNLIAVGFENRFHIADKHYLYANINAMASRGRLDTLDWDKLNYKIGGAIGYSFDSIVGPVDLFFSMGNSKNVTAFFNIGYYF